MSTNVPIDIEPNIWLKSLNQFKFYEKTIQITD